jgi:hypothetical protein
MASSPTQLQVRAIEKAYDYFNAKLFFGELPRCILTTGRASSNEGAVGSMMAYYWRQANNDEAIHQITLDWRLFIFEAKEVYAVLVHEMVHLWQVEYGDPPKNTYHNKEWAFKMQEVGLVPSHTGKLGGDKTGEKMSHYISSGGRYDQVFTKLPKKCHYPLAPKLPEKEGLLPANVRDAIPKKAKELKGNRKKLSTSKWSYVCPRCKQRAYGGQKLKLNCGTCKEAMVRQKP